MQVLDQIYTGHQCIGKCRERARKTVWWPGLSADLEDVVSKYRSCCMNQAQKTEPMIPSPFLELPWQNIGMDLFDWKKLAYLIIVDYYS